MYNKPEKLIIEEDENLVRDTKSRAILNRDKSSLEAYKEKRNKERKLYKSVDEISELKREFGEIKDLLKQLLAEK
jgi:hypothetical protein